MHVVERVCVYNNLVSYSSTSPRSSTECNDPEYNRILSIGPMNLTSSKRLGGPRRTPGQLCGPGQGSDSEWPKLGEQLELLNRLSDLRSSGLNNRSVVDNV